MVDVTVWNFLSDYRLPVPSNPLQISANKNEFANMEKEDEKTP